MLIDVSLLQIFSYAYSHMRNMSNEALRLYIISIK